MELSLQERRKEILSLLRKTGKVRVCELAPKFGVSEVCIRTDLAELEAHGMLSRVHGGAVSSYDSYYNMSLSQRIDTNSEEKAEIAAACAELIHDNSSVFMNAGTTTLAVMEQLAKKSAVTVITNSIALALEGAKHKNLHIILLGGNVNYKYQYTFGSPVVKGLSEYFADYAVLSVDGIDAENGISTYYYDGAELCSEMVNRARTVIVAADSTKIGRVALKKISDLDPVDYAVTSKLASSATASEIKERGVQMIFA